MDKVKDKKRSLLTLILFILYILNHICEMQSAFAGRYSFFLLETPEKSDIMLSNNIIPQKKE